MKVRKPRAPLGRPRAFDADKALDAALNVFWDRGYEGASLSDLTKAMGINRPSLYAAFGNKEALFRRVLDRYASGSASFLSDALKQPTVLGFVRSMLLSTADGMACSSHPRGCLFVQGALSCGEEADRVRKELIARRLGNRTLLRERFIRAKAEGDLPADADPDELARFVSIVSYGLSIEAVNGATPAQLRQVVERALLAWPAPPGRKRR